MYSYDDRVRFSESDKDGYLKSDLTFDGCHIYGYCYKDWTDFIKKHAVVRDKK